MSWDRLPRGVEHGILDPALPIEATDQVVENWCDVGVRVTYHRVPLEHFLSYSQWLYGLPFLESRVEGTGVEPVSTTQTCNNGEG